MKGRHTASPRQLSRIQGPRRAHISWPFVVKACCFIVADALLYIAFPDIPRSAAVLPTGGLVSGYGMDGRYHIPQLSAMSMATFNGRLFVGTGTEGPADIWSWDGTSWRLENPSGFNPLYDSNNHSVSAFSVFGGRLYMGTHGMNGCEIWSYDGSTWRCVVGPAGAWARGFGDPKNYGVGCLTVFDGQLYVGVNNLSGLQVWRTADGTHWNRVDGYSFGTGNIVATSAAVFGGYLYIGTYNTAGCEVLRTSNGVTWTRVASGGIGDARNRACASMTVFGGKLYIGSLNTSGAQIHSTPDGLVWSRMDGGALGTNNNSVSSMVVFSSRIYAGTWNNARAELWWSGDGFIWNRASVFEPSYPNDLKKAFALHVYMGNLFIGTGDSGAVWRYGGSGYATLANTPYFTDNDNCLISSWAKYNGLLYVGTASVKGCEVWSFDGSSWTKRSQGGFGNRNNTVAMSMTVYSGKLYVGTLNHVEGCEVWSFDGNTWIREVSGGFGNIANESARSMDVFRGKLFVGTDANVSRACEVWVYDGASWTQSVGPHGLVGSGFRPPFSSDPNSTVSSLCVMGDKLYAGTYNTNAGCEVWAFDGGSWSQVNASGFGDINNKSIDSMTVFLGKLVVGTENTTSGCEIWVYDGSSWRRKSSGGFGNSHNEEVTALATFGDMLYAGVSNDDEGCEVFVSSGDLSSWKRAVAQGFGDSHNHFLGGITTSFNAPLFLLGNQAEGCSVRTTGNSWYLAEGATAGGFETWVLVQNPGTSPVHVNFTLNTDRGQVRPPDLQGVEIGAGSRKSFRIDDFVNTYDVSTKVDCPDGLVICERAVYWAPEGEGTWRLGHDSIGISP